MQWWMSILLGLVQGVTEFLPVSSSGHLSIVQKLLGVAMEDKLLFDVLLHVGTLAAVCLAFWKDIAEMFRAVFGMFSAAKRNDASAIPARRLALLVIIATLPLVLMVFFKDSVELLLDNMVFIGCALMATGLLLFLADRMPKGRKDEKTARVLDSVFVGAMQLLAVIPGLSRSGTTISAGLFRGFDRSFAVRFSFLMSLPAVVGATLLEVIDLFSGETQAVPVSEFLGYLPGVLVAAVSGYFSIILLKKLIKSGKFGKFAYYCLAVGLLTIAITLIVG